MTNKITVIDYGVGNISSVVNGFNKIGVISNVSDNCKFISQSKIIVLPGVGAFAPAMRKLEESGIKEALETAKLKGAKILGICLGMQLLLTESHEFGLTKGLNFIPGDVVKIDDNKKLPHIGWNNVHFKEQTIAKYIPQNSNMYFVHSYKCNVSNENLLSTVRYGNETIASIISHKNVLGMQFHPEKSGENGLKLMRYFIENENYSNYIC